MRNKIKWACTARASRPRRRGFTLVEMLVVVLIMALLIGMLVRTLGGAGQKVEIAATQAKIEKLKAALEEFYAEYGQYPPVPFYDKIQPVAFEYPAQYTGKNENYSGTRFLTVYTEFTESEAQRLFTMGLTSFLVPRYETVKNGSPYFGINPSALSSAKANPQWKKYTPADKDLQRDLDAYARWKPFLDGVIDGSEYPRGTSDSDEKKPSHINLGSTITDSWNQELRYESLPPHQSYKVWSIGPNGKDENGRGDDIGVAMNK